MHFHQKIHDYLLNYRKKFDDSFNFIVRQRASLKDKNYLGGKFAQGLVFQGTNDYCFVGLVDKSGGANATKSVGLVFKPTPDGYTVNFDIVFPGETDQDLIDFYKNLASNFDNVRWDPKGTRAYIVIGEFEDGKPQLIYDWLQQYYPIIKQVAYNSEIPDLIISDQKFLELQENSQRKLKEAAFEVQKREQLPSYWIFQGNPNIYNITKALKAGHLRSWKIAAHKDKIRVGDKVIIWQTGTESGCYALGEVTSDVSLFSELDYELHYYEGDFKQDSESLRVTLKITNYSADSPILWSALQSNPIFENFKAGNQGTNFSATEEEFFELKKLITNAKGSNRKYWLIAPGENAHKWNEFYQNGEIAIGWNAIGDLRRFKSPKEIKLALQESYRGEGSKKNDTIANWEFANVVNVGDIVIAKKGRRELLGYGIVESAYYWDDGASDFKHKRKVDWKTRGNWVVDHNLVLKTFTDITPYNSERNEFNFYYEYLMSFMEEHSESLKKERPKNNVINQILYGPPGTGKTYTLQNEYFKEYTVKETSLTRQQFLDQMISDLTWWQVLSMALLDLGKVSANEILNHEVIQTKTKLSNSTNSRATVWGRLQAHTVQECNNVNVSDRSEPRIFFKDENSNWSLIQKNLEEFYPEAIINLDKSKNFIADADKQIKNYEFVTFHQSFSYEDFVEGIKPKMEEGQTDLEYQIEDGVFKKLCTRAKLDPENNYAIFIDEINRGNVSAIFGELITLIEKDKRAGAINALEVQLPYSKGTFSVPDNIHIYGTMNTADRSVEALDTALRRRFTFKELMPDSSLLADKEFEDFTLKEVLDTINERIEVLVDRDHTIGHSYFLTVDSGDTEALTLVFQDKIIPLLQEYFYHDYAKIALILGSGFVQENNNNKVQFASFQNIEVPSIETQFILINEIEDIKKAVLILLNKTTDLE